MVQRLAEGWFMVGGADLLCDIFPSMFHIWTLKFVECCVNLMESMGGKCAEAISCWDVRWLL